MDSILSPQEISNIGQRVYHDVFMAEYEPEHNGEYLAINIKTFLGTLSHSPEGAIMKAMERDPHGLYHLVRIGYTGAFKINHAKSKATSWVFG